MDKQKRIVHRRPFAESVIVSVVMMMSILVPTIAMAGVAPLPSADALRLNLEKELRVPMGVKELSDPARFSVNQQYRMVHAPVSRSTSEEAEEFASLPDASLAVGALMGSSENPWMAAEQKLGGEVMRFLEDECVRQRVPAALALGVIEAESNFKADIVSPTEDYGLMQINAGPNFAYHNYYKELLGVNDMTNPYDNITTGVYMLGKDLAQYGGNVELTLMSYHLGTYSAEKKWASGVRSTYATQKQLKNYYKYLASQAL